MLRIALLAAHADEAAALAQAIQASDVGHPSNGTTVLADSHPPLMEELRDAEAPADRIEAAARRHAVAYPLTLLCGLETGSQRQPVDAEAEALHARLRSALHAAPVTYQVLYGDLPARLRQACEAVQALAGHGATGRRSQRPAAAQIAHERPARLRAYGCEKCSDPECERLLFQRLLADR